MRITNLLTKETIILSLQSVNKADAIEELVSKLDYAGKLSDREKFKESIMDREKQSTTGIGEGIAIPHAKTTAVKEPAIAFGKSVTGIEFESLDGNPAHLFFMIAAPEGANNAHLEALARLSSILMNEEARKELMNANDEADIIKIINSFDEEKEDDIQTSNEEALQASVIAVTACPTGIAHTYMAADALKAKAAELGVSIKVETNGSGGARNVLTAEDIEKAAAVIVAADTKVDTDRFIGKPVIKVPVAEGIRKPQELLERAIKQDAPIFSGSGSNRMQDGEAEIVKSKKSYFYQHLMNGVSNMLPFVVGGGILIAISFMFGIHSADPTDPSYNAFAAALNTIGGGNAFGLMIPVLAGFIAMSIADRPGLAPGMVGGLLAATGEAGFLGGLIAGFLAGYIVLLLKKLFAGLPLSLEGIKPVLLYPLFSIFLTGMIMLFAVIDPVKAINTGLTNWLNGFGTGNLVLMGMILGAMMAIDMGGPINKAAFTFGIAMIDAGNYAPHAAIMAGGMVPPLGLALATTIFKSKFTKQEKDAGKTNYIMGATFITEGAIPFAAADPMRVIPAAVAGSAVAGALSMVFKIGLPAPHGGLFVVPIIEGNILLYILAILAGTIVTALIVGILKKTIK
ncbi:PTS fructose transporter subunit IIABC [Lederbergia lenta]|uniref:PTS system fructose-specific transporter subunit IIABC n=1 Tax=Lederbergia lenta TaxID=1467 RepID=A0A2X4WFT3_LEDLE|nr:PTS fructose transporter subunit IIABC [Lederbergia lenta]MEC2322723.1 fructose-specific PTS transporter subunit EIIC [Lederbergia lenta]SQI61669.1 PTS system fructose-specific transporter subunit IIABC [Lederbergia lenta]